MSERTCDTLVIGSGFGGARWRDDWPRRVMTCSWSRRVRRSTRPRLPADPGPGNFFRRYLKSTGNDALNLTYAEALGGGSGFYEMVSLRAPTQAFEQRDGDGRRLWPAGVDRRTLDPWYDVAERELMSNRSRRGRPRTGIVFARLMSSLGYSTERARYAVQGCLGSGFCIAGCIYGAKQSLLLNYLPRARAAGAAILTGYEAIALRPLAPDGPPRNPALPRDLARPYEVTLPPARMRRQAPPRRCASAPGSSSWPAARSAARGSCCAHAAGCRGSRPRSGATSRSTAE